MRKQDRLEIYENFFHQVNMHRTMMNAPKLQEAIDLIDTWSYAHRISNGTLTEYKQKKQVDAVVEKMRKY